MAAVQKLIKHYPWIQTPFIVGAPMRLISLGKLAVEISRAGGLGFIGSGYDVSELETHLQLAQSTFANSASHSQQGTLPIGIGFITWGAPLDQSINLIQKYKPAASWLFAARDVKELQAWAEGTRKVSPNTKVWVQIGSVKQAIEALAIKPDVLVVQGSDAGGHGLVKGAGIVTLVPEVIDAVEEKVGTGEDSPIILAAGGIMDARGTAAALALGASGVVLGTRFLATPEAILPKGHQEAVLAASDGGQTTVRTKLYDSLRGTKGWADEYDGRGIINKSWTDALEGMSEEENRKLYFEAMKNEDAGYGVEGRMTTYAGAGVGLVKSVKGAGEIVKEIREGTKNVLAGLQI